MLIGRWMPEAGEPGGEVAIAVVCRPAENKIDLLALLYPLREWWMGRWG
jgi:hypothetical protein